MAKKLESEKQKKKAQKASKERISNKIAEIQADRAEKDLPPLEKNESNFHRAMRALQTMKRRDIQRECIIRGMEFKLVAGGSTPDLISFFQNNLDNPGDNTLLALYDAWKDEELAKGGYSADDPIRSPIFKFGMVGNPDQWDEGSLKRSTKSFKQAGTQSGRISGMQPGISNLPREKVELRGAVKAGTKKAMTFKMAQMMDEKSNFTYSKEEIITEVIKEFPLAVESSIKAWISKARKLTANSKP